MWSVSRSGLIVRRRQRVTGRRYKVRERDGSHSDKGASFERGTRYPGLEFDGAEVDWWDGPEGFGNDFAFHIKRDVDVAFILAEPAAAAAMWVKVLRGGGFGSGDMVKNAAVDELLGFDLSVAVDLREEIGVFISESKLMSAHALQFTMVVVSGIRPRIGHSFRGRDCEVELGSEFEVDETLFVLESD